LLDAGTNIDEIEYGSTPLYEAVTYSKIPIIKLLLSRGANVNFINSLTGTSILVAAVKNSNLAIVRLLLEHGANPNPAPSFGETPLSIARIHKDSIYSLPDALEIYNLLRDNIPP